MTLEQKIQQVIETLQPLSPTVTKLASVVAQAEFSVNDIVEIVQYDTALTAQILRIANSPFSGSNRTIATIRDAVIRLGGGRILQVVIGAHIKDDCEQPVPSYGYSDNTLWRHDVAAATASELLRTYTDVDIGGLAFTASLLHDIGKIIIGRTAPEKEMNKIWALVSDEVNLCNCVSAERKILGITHPEVGAQLLIAWELPEVIVSAIKNHHIVASSDSEADVVSDAVRISNMVAKVIGEGIGYEGMNFGIDEKAAVRLGLNHERFEKLCAATADRFRTILQSFG